MADLNKVMIIGNLGQDPEIRYTANGSAVVTFSVAANRNYRRPDGEWEKETEWFSVVAWNQLAERISQNLQKGSRVYVEGRLHTRSWEGQDGQRRFKTEVVAQTVLPQDRRQQPVAVAAGEYGGGDADITEPDDLPFE
ncbi:MAG: single-stranded DNA-binding protein [Dehalococcoidia bacterium]